MSSVLDNLKYTKEHEWLKAEGGLYWVGVTNHAQDSMGDIVFVELPNESLEVKQGDVVATIESVKAVSEIYAPISGTIVEVNSALSSTPDAINSSPYENGWIFKIKSDTYDQESSGLIDEIGYKKILASL